MSFNPFVDNESAAKKFSFEDLVPEVHRDKNWAKSLADAENPHEELLKQFEGLQSKIGERPLAALPENATPEQVANFRKAVGVPEDIKGYETKPIEWTPEEKPFGEQIANVRPASFIEDLKAAALANNIPKATFEKMLEAHDRIAVKHLREQRIATAKTESDFEQDFNTKFDTRYGERKNQVIELSGKMAAALLPPEDMVYWNQLDNTNRMLFADLMMRVNGKYVREDSFSTRPGSSPSAPDPMAARRALNDLMKSDAYTNAMHPDHDAVVAKVNKGYQNLPPAALEKSLSYL
jgi:hypothetical protein